MAVRVAPRSFIDVERRAGLGPALEVWARRKWLALLVFGAAFGGVASVVLSLPDLYRSTATVLVEREQISEAFIRPSITAELETRIQLIREQVMSRARLKELIERLDLYPEARTKLPLDTVVDRMRRDIQLELKGVEQPMSGRSATVAFTISYIGREPHTVATAANALAGLYVKENTRIREGQAVRTAEILRGQLQDVKRALDAQERRTTDFKLTHATELPQQVEANLASLERLNTQLRLNGESQLRAMDRRDRLERELRQTASAPIAETPASDEQRLTKMREQIAELKSQFTDQHPDVAHLNLDLQALERRMAQRSPDGRERAASEDFRPNPRQGMKDIEAELGSLKEEELALRRAIGGYEQRVENAPKRQQDLQAMSRDYESTKERYDALLKRYEEAQLAETMEQGQKVEQFRILDPAIPPREPAAPGRLRILLMGFIAALGLAGAAVLAAEKLNMSFHTFDDLREAVTIPLLVRVPLILSTSDTRRRRRRNAALAASAAVGLMLVIAGSHFLSHGNEQLVRLMERGRL
jgi:protein tyrosine kinase modulator